MYVDRCRVEVSDSGVELQDEAGTVQVPTAVLSTLLAGPGTTVTHAAVCKLAESGCGIVWCGDGAVRFYASGTGETRSSANLLAQVDAWSLPITRLAVARRMYSMRFADPPPEGCSMEQLRGLEGVRVRDAYAAAAKRAGVKWEGRRMKPGDWNASDPVNRALSAANACLYGICHVAIVAVGFSPALGFVHTGKALSFVYDVADLYKTEVSVPLAFAAMAEVGDRDLEREVRVRCRETFFAKRLLERIVPDVQTALGLKPDKVAQFRIERDLDEPGDLWDLESGAVRGGRNYSVEAPVDSDEDDT